jgi:hypothetical protein
MTKSSGCEGREDWTLTTRHDAWSIFPRGNRRVCRDPKRADSILRIASRIVEDRCRWSRILISGNMSVRSGTYGRPESSCEIFGTGQVSQHAAAKLTVSRIQHSAAWEERILRVPVTRTVAISACRDRYKCCRTEWRHLEIRLGHNARKSI